MRAARLISLVLLLQNRESMTAAELASELEVSERTVNRDVLALSETGIPVYADRGRTGGYRLVDGYRTRLTGLSRSEAEALFLSGAPGPLGEMGLTEAVATAQLKVLAALPKSLRDTSTRSAQRFHLEARWWHRSTEAPKWLSALARAVWSDEVVSAAYRRGDETVERTLEPYGLVWKGGTWYAVARVPSEEKAPGFRVYRVDRFESVTSHDEHFERDETFDLAAFWGERALEFARSILTTEVRLRIGPIGRRGLSLAIDPVAADDAEIGEPGPDGWSEARLRVESVDIAYSQLLTLGPEVEILEPVELRERLAEAARRTVALYAGG